MQKSTKRSALKWHGESGFLLIELAVAFTLSVLGFSLLISFYQLCDQTHNFIVSYFEKVAVLQNAMRATAWNMDGAHCAENVQIESGISLDDYFAVLGPQLPSFVAHIPHMQLSKGIISWQDRVQKKHAVSFIVGRPA